MFRITEDASSGSLVQCLAKKITRKILSCPLTWTRSVLCHNTDLAHVNGHDRIILVVLSQALYKVP
jgi:hypothetical protein